MSAHDYTVPLLRRRVSSAEPFLGQAWKALRVCEKVVLADRLDGELRDIPLLTSEELERANELFSRGLATDEDKREAHALLNLKKERSEARAWYLRRGARRSTNVVLAAALRVERAVQDAYWGFGGPGSRMRAHDARVLWDAQYQAHEAVVSRLSRKRAKENQREAGAGRRPLTVCVGKRARRLPEAVLAKHAPDLLERYGDNIVPLGAGDGCGLIFVDSLADRVPKRYCERCRKKAGNSMNAGKAKNARHRLKNARKRR